MSLKPIPQTDPRAGYLALKAEIDAAIGEEGPQPVCQTASTERVQPRRENEERVGARLVP